MIAATEAPNAVATAREAVRSAEQRVRDGYATHAAISTKLEAAEAALVTADAAAVTAVASLSTDDDSAAMAGAAQARVRRDALATALTQAAAENVAADRAVVHALENVKQAQAAEHFGIVEAEIPKLEAALKAFADAYKAIDGAFTKGMQLRGPRGTNSTPTLYLAWQVRRELMKSHGVDLDMAGRNLETSTFTSITRAIAERLAA